LDSRSDIEDISDEEEGQSVTSRLSVQGEKDTKSPTKNSKNPFKEIKALSRALTKGSVYFARTVKHKQQQH